MELPVIGNPRSFPFDGSMHSNGGRSPADFLVWPHFSPNHLLKSVQIVPCLQQSPIRSWTHCTTEKPGIPSKTKDPIAQSIQWLTVALIVVPNVFYIYENLKTEKFLRSCSRKDGRTVWNESIVQCEWTFTQRANKNNSASTSFCLLRLPIR